MPIKFSISWAMPSRWTFQIKPIWDFVCRYIGGASVIVDPFCGSSTLATHSNDLARVGGQDAGDFCIDLLRRNVAADVVIFDPPYSPRQINECYNSIGLPVGTEDTQSAALYARVKPKLIALLRCGGVALSFGWSTSGLGKELITEEILCVQHGGAHNDTICVAQRKPPTLFD